ncbi:hypothetical protein CLHOM_24470 [Clostridium homopropionicum DSM 5847]|uniref:Uncharacterized protein n=1 Tax=Clostridium homopropionicum DSM 5847 TaxID=1121318 RepID=A0A0L6Z8P2_9CLOT|nr:hypothetical protein [Clostridium homopropionicum]KOA19341.1 hypothetical protein CLHOM_24470 [Clostridium homopropionicum DSM 5847]SFG21761.1 hypothetical protein SAMN04488501_106207 [Clostridium homopropionicum]
MYQTSIRRRNNDYSKDYFEEEERKPIKFVFPNDNEGDRTMSDKDISPQESITKYIRVMLLDENNKQITYERKDGYRTTVEDGYEDLNLIEDSIKISLYQTAEHIELYNNKKYKVINRSFMPCCPVCLYLTLKEI